jgi:hypothetical protein
MSVPTITRAPPVAQEGMLAKMGEKKTEMRKASPVVTAVRPVLPPSAIPDVS